LKQVAIIILQNLKLIIINAHHASLHKHVVPSYVLVGDLLGTVWYKTLVGENFGGVGTARKLAEKTLAVDKTRLLFS